MMYAEHLRVLIKASCRCIKQQTQSDLHVCNTLKKQRTAIVYATNGALQTRGASKHCFGMSIHADITSCICCRSNGATLEVRT